MNADDPRYICIGLEAVEAHKIWKLSESVSVHTPLIG